MSSKQQEQPDDADAQMRRLSRRSFLWAGLATGGTIGGLVAFNKRAKDEDGAKARAYNALPRFAARTRASTVPQN